PARQLATRTDAATDAQRPQTDSRSWSIAPIVARQQKCHRVGRTFGDVWHCVNPGISSRIQLLGRKRRRIIRSVLQCFKEGYRSQSTDDSQSEGTREKAG